MAAGGIVLIPAARGGVRSRGAIDLFQEGVNALEMRAPCGGLESAKSLELGPPILDLLLDAAHEQHRLVRLALLVAHFHRQI